MDCVYKLIDLRFYEKYAGTHLYSVNVRPIFVFESKNVKADIIVSGLKSYVRN